jgi:hypothetical protein
MTARNSWTVGFVIVLACATAHVDETPAASQREPPALPAIAPAALCVTHGETATTNQRLQIRDPEVRAFARGTTGDAAALAFTYLGPTDATSTLASGDVRQQLGLKLRAQDGCNLVYVMWRIDPKPGIVVQVKQNPGQRTAQQCGANGYTRIKAAHSVKIAAPDVGSEHVLAAALDGDDLVAWVDGRIAWRGSLGGLARGLSGVAGVRSDNVQADIELHAAAGSGTEPCPHDRDARGD